MNGIKLVKQNTQFQIFYYCGEIVVLGKISRLTVNLSKHLLIENSGTFFKKCHIIDRNSE